MKTHKTILIALFMLTFIQLLTSQVVNIEKARQQTDTTGISGSAELSGTFLDNDEVIYTLNLLADVQYKAKKDIFLLIGDYKITKSEEVSFQNAAFLHFRYGHEFSDFFRWEAFTQIQNNKISKLNLRFLLGTGPRFKLIDNDFMRAYLGVAPMYEYEQIDDAEETIEKAIRVSNYFSVTFLFSDNAKLFATTYYQPKINEILDYRFYAESSLDIKIFKKLIFVTKLNYAWDANPPTKAPRRYLQLKSGLSMGF